jgi:hypothetical protein
MWSRMAVWWTDYRETRLRHKAAWWASLPPARRAEWVRWRRDGWIMAGVAAAAALVWLLARIGTSP